MRYTVRDALKKEVAQIAKIHVDSWQVAYKGLMPKSYIEQFTIERRERMWARVMTEQLAQLIVVERQREIVGFLSYELPNHTSEDKTALVTCCYVTPLHYGQGAGSALLDELETRLLSTSVMQISLKALDTNQQGLNFYKKCGFVRTGEEESEVIESMTLTDLTLVKYIARS
ncbi:GNAT family N-acetyltransferase [Vibrio alginolyticus]|uniref:GNAT family N-acetyltransferase n=2 Tax=Vibrionaceae TaxID=641 RepID=UPI001BD2D2ED|nr:GNAT family N-acetyltransferase [Vibrio alginolyticus]MBS9859441.1 GNAT family N-acetyltransferase [Vibrio alginolyticus]